MNKFLDSSFGIPNVIVDQIVRQQEEIESLRQKLASRDEEVAELKQQSARRLEGLCKCGIERDQLREQVTRLRGVLKLLPNRLKGQAPLVADRFVNRAQEIALEALAATEHKP